MFYVNETPILCEEIVVLQTLKECLQKQGINLFNQFKITQNNIQFNCPIHANGQERKPSCGITTNNTERRPAGVVHCFACGYTATLDVMISNCFGYDDLGAYGRKWLIENFLSGVEARRNIEFDFSRGLSSKKPQQYISEEQLDQYRYVHPYVYKRRLTDDIIEKFDIGYDPSFMLGDKKLRCITFPVRDETGGTLFIARRCIDAKIFNYPAGVNKPVYGVYELPKDASEVIICESMFNALTCYVYGKPAVALLGLGIESQFDTLRRLPYRKYILALDPDDAGKRASDRLQAALYNKIVTRYVIPEGKDINDLEFEEFSNLLEIF